jgi:hypothetical protein
MKHKITCNGKVIAEFVHESDRSLCLMALEEAYSDCAFYPYDEE